MFDTNKALLQQIEIINCSEKRFFIDVKRDDLIDDLVSGNKWRKLKYNLLAAQAQKKSTILTFGGAYSNHLIATAKACSIFGMKSIGIVRGDELQPDSNETLRACHAFGMRLIFISREDYFLRDDKSYLEQLHIDFPNSYIVPEGGANFYGLTGCQEIWQELDDSYTDVVVAAGTGTTAAGLLSGIPENAILHVFSALKGDFMRQDILKKIEYGFHNQDFTDFCAERLRVYSEDIFGGYGKCNDELIDFIHRIKIQHNLPLDQVYTGKAFYRLIKMLDDNQFSENSKILFIHTGGLQGNSASQVLEVFSFLQ